VLTNQLIRVVGKPRLVAELASSGAAQRGEQRFEQREIFLSGRRELQQYWSEPVTEWRDPPGEDSRQADTVEAFR
jgi:hypothetical protein